MSLLGLTSVYIAGMQMAALLNGVTLIIMLIIC